MAQVLQGIKSPRRISGLGGIRVYKVDYNYNAEHEAAIRIAERRLRPFSRYFVIGKPITYNADFLPI